MLKEAGEKMFADVYKITDSGKTGKEDFDVEYKRNDWQIPWFSFPSEESDPMEKLNSVEIDFKNSWQRDMYETFIDVLQAKIKQLYMDGALLSPIPKLSVMQDEDRDILINWLNNIYRIFINISKEKESSFWGMTYNKQNGGVVTKTEPFATNDAEREANEILSVILPVILTN